MKWQVLKSIILVLFLSSCVACGHVGLVNGLAEDTEEELSVEDGINFSENDPVEATEPVVIDLDGDVVELDEDYSVEVDGLSTNAGGSATQPSEGGSDTELEPDVDTVGMLPTPAKADGECAAEGATEIATRSLDLNSDRRDFQDQHIIASVDVLVCELDEDGNMTWQPVAVNDIATTHSVAVGFMDQHHYFEDENFSLHGVGPDGNVFIPREYLAVQRGEKVYVAFFDKNRNELIDKGAVVISNIGSTIKMTFPPSLSFHLGSK